MNRALAVGIFWSGLEATVAGALSFTAAFAVARLIGPAEVGIGAAAVAVHVLLWVAVNALFADALVQRVQLDHAAFCSALGASLLVGIAAASAQAVSGWPLARALDDARLPVMALVLALPLPLVGLAGPVQGVLTRERRYRALAGRTIVGQGVGTVAGIGAALLGAGAWALVVQQALTSTAGALVLLLRMPQRPHWRCNGGEVRGLLRIGLPLTVSTLVQHGRYRVFALLIGGTAGAAALGQVHVAFRLVDAMRELAFTAQWRLMLPVLSELQHDVARLRNGVDRCLAWSGLLAFPLCGAMAVVVAPLVRLLLGSAWQPSAEAALPLIGLTTWLFLAFPAGVAVVARGEPRYTLIANVAGTLATVGFVLLLRPASPVQSVLVWFGAQFFVSPYILHSNARVLQTRPLRPLRAGAAPLALAAIASLGAVALPRLFGEPDHPAMLIILRLAIGAGIWLPGAALLPPSPIALRNPLRYRLQLRRWLH